MSSKQSEILAGARFSRQSCPVSPQYMQGFPGGALRITKHPGTAALTELRRIGHTLARVMDIAAFSEKVLIVEHLMDTFYTWRHAEGL